MHEIDSPGSVAGKFVDENPETNTPGAILWAKWLNNLQAEMMSILAARGITPDATKSDQILKAILEIASGADITVRYTTKGNIVHNGLAVQAGGDWAAPLTVGDLILDRTNAVPEDNGWYVAAAGGWARLNYLDSSAEIKPGSLTKVTEGATLADSIWMLTSDAPIVLNASHLNFERKDSGFTQAMADARFLSKQSMLLQDEKPSGTNGGASNTGMNIRVLNTVSFNTISGASLTANQITLPPGIYRISGRVPAAKCDTHKGYLFNVTDNVIALSGASVNASAPGTSDQVYTDSWVEGRLVLTGIKVFELRHWILTGAGTDGLGANCNFPGLVEVYSQLKITREGD